MQPLSQAVPAVVQALLRDSPVTPGKVEFAWRAVVGNAIGRVTRVHLDGRTLLVEADTPAWEREISRSAPLLLTRLGRLLGENVIDAIRVRR